MRARVALWLLAFALVVLGGRSLAYALAPHPQLVGSRLEEAVGGPSLVVVAVAALAGALATAVALVWIASLGVRERHALAGGPPPAPIRLRRVVAAFAGLWVSSCLAFAALESYLHWRAGLGFHGIHCLVGPVHRDAIPILAALSLVAAAAAEAVRHVWLWMRRRLDALARARVRLGIPALVVATQPFAVPSPAFVVDLRSRGPPPLPVSG
jgi:hypothetical protein